MSTEPHTTTDGVDVAAITRITRDSDARDVARAAYDQLLGLLRRLQPSDWSRPTDCDAWHVADMVRHLVGAAEGHARRRELLRQLALGALRKRDHDGNAMDAMNQVQVDDNAELSPGELVARLRALAPRAVATRMALPGPLRSAPVPVDLSGSVAAGTPHELRLGHLQEAVLSRDVWLHSIDIERATGHRVERTADLDGRIVADVVAEWATSHGEPVRLHLTGPAGGRFRQGTDGERIERDAIEFCRVLSGRAPADHPLLERRVWF